MWLTVAAAVFGRYGQKLAISDGQWRKRFRLATAAFETILFAIIIFFCLIYAFFETGFASNLISDNVVCSQSHYRGGIFLCYYWKEHGVGCLVCERREMRMFVLNFQLSPLYLRRSY